jgi:hypothetical protein
MIELISAIFLLILVIIGAVYVNCVDDVPVWERAQVLGVGFGIYFGIIGLACNVTI